MLDKNHNIACHWCHYTMRLFRTIKATLFSSLFSDPRHLKAHLLNRHLKKCTSERFYVNIKITPDKCLLSFPFNWYVEITVLWPVSPADAGCSTQAGVARVAAYVCPPTMESSSSDCRSSSSPLNSLTHHKGRGEFTTHDGTNHPQQKLQSSS